MTNSQCLRSTEDDRAQGWVDAAGCLNRLRVMNEVPPIHDVPPNLPPSYRDRRIGLILFGVLEIVLGVLCLLMAGGMVIGQLMLARSAGTPASLQTIIPGMLFYPGVAVALVWLGIGSIQCRRWARALMLIQAWMWLCTGLLMVPMMAWLMPKILASAPEGGQALPPGAMVVVVVIQIVFMGVFFILLPGGLVLFYRSPHVKGTCEARDRVRRWTDACPVPVLAVVCMMWWGAIVTLGLPLTGFGMLPFFGMLLTGIPGALAMIGMACVLFWIGRSWYRLNVVGWWALVTVMMVFAVSNVLTFVRVDIIEVYQKLGYPQAQIDLIQKHGWMTSGFMMWSSLFWVLPVLGYLLWAKRFFRATS